MPVSLPHPFHITRKDGTYYYRRRLPRALCMGCEIAIGLRTRHFREAEFLAETINRAFDGVLARARAVVTADRVDLNAILRTYLREDLAEHLRGDIGPSGAYPLGMWPLERLNDAANDLRSALADRDPKNLHVAVKALMERYNLFEVVRHQLGIGVLEAELKVVQEAIRRAKGGKVGRSLAVRKSADCSCAAGYSPGTGTTRRGRKVPLPSPTPRRF